MNVFGFLTSKCLRCNSKSKLYKVNDGVWLCSECLKAGEYDISWAEAEVLKKNDEEKTTKKQ